MFFYIFEIFYDCNFAEKWDSIEQELVCAPREGLWNNTTIQGVRRILVCIAQELLLMGLWIRPALRHKKIIHSVWKILVFVFLLKNGILLNVSMCVHLVKVCKIIPPYRVFKKMLVCLVLPNNRRDSFSTYCHNVSSLVSNFELGGLRSNLLSGFLCILGSLPFHNFNISCGFTVLNWSKVYIFVRFDFKSQEKLSYSLPKCTHICETCKGSKLFKVCKNMLKMFSFILFIPISTGVLQYQTNIIALPPKNTRTCKVFNEINLFDRRKFATFNIPCFLRKTSFTDFRFSY